MDELIQQFPTKQELSEPYKSFIFQPERVSLNSRQSLLNVVNQIGGNNAEQFTQAPDDTYYQFKCQLKTPLLHVHSLELLRASIPYAVPSIPNDECFFFYYRVDSEGGIAPNYEQFTADNIYCIYLYPTGFLTPPTAYPNYNEYGWNTAFPDYDSLVSALNNAAENNDIRLGNRFIANDISFSYEPTLNKIMMKGNNIFQGNTQIYFYSPVGFNDPNLQTVIAELQANFDNPNYPGDDLGKVPMKINSEGYTLNRRLGFTFNGQNVDNILSLQQFQALSTRLLPQGDTGGVAYTPNNCNPNYVAENFCDLVNTGNIFLYADIVGGSTQDTNTSDRLLAVIPSNASSLGVVFGESKLPCELKKTSENIYNITFTMRDDKGSPFTIPTNAYVNLELKINYK